MLKHKIRYILPLLAVMVSAAVRRYLDQRLPEETFAQRAHRADEEALQ